MPMLTAHEVADELRLPLRRVYECVRSGLVPHVRIGKQIRFDPERLREWIDAGGQSLNEKEHPSPVVGSRGARQ